MCEHVTRSLVALVQERVHSTAVGAEAAFTFLLQVIEELDDAIEEFLPSRPHSEPLVPDHEVELGMLLSTASLVRQEKRRRSGEKRCSAGLFDKSEPTVCCCRLSVYLLCCSCGRPFDT